jgi:DNA-binding beta-propeller fold protein YncE
MRFSRLLFCASLALLSLPAQALAAANHPFLSAIIGAPPGYEDACGVAFGPAGLYISDYYHDTIVGSPGIAAESPGDGPCKLAFDPAGNLYVNNWHRNVLKYTEPFTPGSGTPIDPKEEAGAEKPTGLTVDPATGNLYVAHHTYIAEYKAPVEAGETPVKIGLTSLKEAYGVAVSDFPATKGFLYVPDARENTVKVFNPAVKVNEPIEAMDGSATPQGAFTYLLDAEVAVDNSPTSPSYGHLFVLDAIGHGLSEQPKAVLDEFNAAGAYRGQIAGFTDAEPSGIAFEEGTHNVYVTSGNSEGSAVFVYGPTAPAHTLKVSKTGTGGGSVSSSPAGISCGTACAAEYNQGEHVTLFAAPDSHSTFTGWTVSGAEPCPGAGSCTVILAKDVEVSAGFEEPTQRTLTVSGIGEGSITSSPSGISCPSSCSEHFNEGRLVTLTASPLPHNKLLAWGGACSGTPVTEPCKVTMSEAKSASAEFASIPQKTLTVTTTGSGQGTVTSTPAGISCPSSCSAPFDQGSSVTLTAVAAPTAAFAGFSGGGCSGDNTCTVTIGATQVVSAEFAPNSSSAETAATLQGASQAAALNAPASVAPLNPVLKKNHPHRKHKHRKHRRH